MKPTLKQMFLGRHSHGFIDIKDFKQLYPEYEGTVRLLPLSTINCVRPTGFIYDLSHIIGCHRFFIFEQPIVDIKDVEIK